MIIVSGRVEFDPKQRAAALAAASELFEPTRAQSGCRDYVWCADPSNEGRVYVYECWQDTESFSAHLAGPWYKNMLELLGKNGLRGAEVAKHRIEKSEPVYDKTGKPRADFFTG